MNFLYTLFLDGHVLYMKKANEKAEVVANCDHLKKLKFSPVLPYAFTEHGAIMAASVLNTPRSIEASRGWENDI